MCSVGALGWAAAEVPMQGEACYQQQEKHRGWLADCLNEGGKTKPVTAAGKWMGIHQSATTA